MRVVVPAVMGLAVAMVAMSSAARADHEPVLVVPGRSDVPVIINGRDASWGVVEGDWGLYRPGHMGRTVYGGRPAYWEPAVDHYFPAVGRRPRVGRYEVEPPPNRTLPPPAPTYHRSWSTQSDMGAPVTEYPPFDPPPVILAPPYGGPHGRPGWDRPPRR